VFAKSQCWECFLSMHRCMVSAKCQCWECFLSIVHVPVISHVYPPMPICPIVHIHVTFVSNRGWRLESPLCFICKHLSCLHASPALAHIRVQHTRLPPPQSISYDERDSPFKKEQWVIFYNLFWCRHIYTSS
jgi:hypothetical protein